MTQTRKRKVITTNTKESPSTKVAKSHSVSPPPQEVPWLQYIEFKSQLLDPISIADPFFALTEFIHNPNFFLASPDKSFRAGLTWTNFQDLFIVAYENKRYISLLFLDYIKSDSVLLELAIRPDTITIVRCETLSPWLHSDYADIVNDFCSAFPKAKLLPVSEEQSNASDKSMATFQAIIQHNQTRNVTTRIMKRYRETRRQ
ncbi:MAG: hypothetical protein ABI296_05410 [Gammaproteobacteria bacterium]